MTIAGNDRASRANAHMMWSERYNKYGDTAKAMAHFGRAMHYSDRSGFGGSEADKICTLLFDGVPITSHNYHNEDYYLKPHPRWKPYFELDRTERGKLKATERMRRSINELNGRGQSILYCAYRFLPLGDSSADFKASIECLLSVPGINIGIRNSVHSSGEIDMALSGMAADHPDLSFIVHQISEYARNDGAYGSLVENCNVFDIINNRILKSQNYKPFGVQGQKPNLT